MKLKKILALILAVLIATTILSACGKSATDVDETASSAPITVVGDGATDFIIVKPQNSTENEREGALSIYKAYRSAYDNVAPGNRDDSVARADDVKEIIIGNTNRPETEFARELLLEKTNMYADEYVICAVNGNIVIYAAADLTLPKAVEYFIGNYVSAAEIPGDLAFVATSESDYIGLNIGGQAKLYDFAIVRSHYETSYLTQVELESLQSVLLDKTGYHVPIVEDAYVAAGDKEIIIGGCNREGQTAYEDDLVFYEIKVEGTKIYISGGSDYAVAVGVRELTDLIKNGTTAFSDGVIKTGDYEETISSYGDSEYKLVWSDEFNGSKINEDIWRVSRGKEGSNTAPDGKPVYRSTDASTFLRDGKLYMLALKDDEAYYGGMIRTVDSFNYQYGFIEAKVKVPDGDGFWSGFWLNSKSTIVPDRYLYAEFDIMENFGNATGFTPALHRWPTKLGLESGIPDYEKHTTPTYQGIYANKNERRVVCPDDRLFSDDFHTVGCLWTEDRITITVDGKSRNYLDTTLNSLDVEAFNGYQFVILSLATYFESCPLTPNATEEEWQNSNQFIVEYVRLFQNDKCDIRWQ